MAEETKVENSVEPTAEIAPQGEEIDYDKELEEAATKEANWQAGAQRIAKKQTEEEPVEEDIATQVAAKLLPQLKSVAESSALDLRLDRVAGNNESLKKLVKFHYENSTNPNKDLQSRIDDAYAIANKKVIDKTVKEINVARAHTAQISNIGQGSNQEQYQKPGANVLSDNQLKELESMADRYHFRGDARKSFIEGSIKRLNS